MEYKSYQISISELIKMIESDSIELHPSYQRNYIWTIPDQKFLIDSIHKEYPLPNFFVYRRNPKLLEMVDGQQRAVTIFRYFKGEFKDNQRNLYSSTDTEQFLNYKLNIIEITKFFKERGESLEEFYWMVNKRGKHLNTPEVNKARYHDSDFLKIVYSVMSNPILDYLDIFTTKVKTRMNDRSLVEELIAYLFDGITDKRNAVEKLFKDSISETKQKEVEERANRILSRIDLLNSEYPISDTRYKQRNDFYTLWNFIDQNESETDNELIEQYKILLFISKNGFITPSNDECEPFKNYALNCVSQSNSKKAREGRLQFFYDILCNKDIDNNQSLLDIETYFEDIYDIDSLPLKKVGDYQLMDVSKLELNGNGE
jgi:hypothetical protein